MASDERYDNLSEKDTNRVPNLEIDLTVLGATPIAATSCPTVSKSNY
jgi:hypothetical protein